jgi:ATP-dependent helicase HrpB
VNPLPVEEIIPRLRALVEQEGNIVVHAPPGAGKTTRIPTALADLPLFRRGTVLMLEPRRIAAVHAASQMARLNGERPGETIGYTIRFERRVSPRTRIEVVTEGILTRRLQRDPCLEGVAMVIFDEFHERSLHADLALALCLDVQRSLRPDLRLMVMSATLDCGPVSALLGDAPIIGSTGRAFPVEVKYCDDPDRSPFPQRMSRLIRRALSETSGDLLAFLPGAGEIRKCRALLEDLPVSLHELYGELPFREQEKALAPSSGRKVVLATSIAETSITIEGVSVVIDGGLSRAVRHDPSTGLNSLVTLRESRASAEQRRGRGGRLGPGVCYRLFSEHAFRSMTEYSPPEIAVADLAPLALELAVWGVTDYSSLSWVSPPPASAMEAAKDLLRRLGAVDAGGVPTPLGRKMAEMPVHPRLARLMLRGKELGAAREACFLAALLSERDVFRRSAAEAGLCESDLLERLRAIISRSDADRRLNESVAGNVRRSAAQLVKRTGAPAAGPAGPLDPSDAARMLLAAYPDRVAGQREEGGDRYLLASGRGARLSRFSGVRDRSFILAVQVDAGDGAEGIIHQACALDPELVRTECSAAVSRSTKVEWDAAQERVAGWSEEKIGACVLSRQGFSPDDTQALPVLLSALGNFGPRFFARGDTSSVLRGRVNLLRGLFPDGGWPDMSEEALLASLEEWLAPYLSGVRTGRQLRALDLVTPLRGMLSPKQLRELDLLAPIRMNVPSGRSVEIDYTLEEGPVLAVKLQEMFGLADTPTVAAGRVRLRLHLLSPARRPVQVTSDLKGFWEKVYPEVRKELRGRYPKHPWPEDPSNAVPTALTKKGMERK